MKNVLIVNQSAELYGADKALLELLQNYPSGYNPIVVLHQDGPLKEILKGMGIQVIHASVIKVKRGVLTTSFMLGLPFEVIRSFRTIKKELGGKKIHLVHSNAISVFIGAFYSLAFRKKHLWHVHEIIEHPKLLAKAYPHIVSRMANRIVFNSKASFNQFSKIRKGLEGKSAIVHNGQNRQARLATMDEISLTRKTLFGMSDTRTVVIGLVGRISRLKGQQLLLEAFSMVLKKFPGTFLVFVGSAPDGQEHFLEQLQARIKEFKLEHKCTIVPFQSTIWPVYDALDISVVPSTEAESFGLVATESMLSAKPVVGSRLGGLIEIIREGETGYLFECGNADELADKLELLLLDTEKAKSLGQNGLAVVQREFSTEKYVSGIKTQYDLLTGVVDGKVL
ncbi:MAG: glycosyltransferase [Chitinophagaceae bacterium]|nr:MAG: glycosyltransferase [Chitinophagaceae bacterium]